MTTPFTVIVPKDVTESNLYSVNVPENEYPVYNPTTTYNLNDFVIVTTGVHKVYKSLTGASNQGHYPPDNPTKWVEVGPTNRWAMFDKSGGTITSFSGDISFAINADRVTSMAFLDVSASEIRISAIEVATGTPYFDSTLNLNDLSLVENWYEYFTVEIKKGTIQVQLNIPAVTGSRYTITLVNSAGGSTSLGGFIYGESVEFGMTQYNATASNIDYSTKNVDEFGKVTIVKRPFSKRMDVRLFVKSSNVDAVVNRLNSLRATPCFWIGSKESYESLSIYGFYRDYSMDISYPTYSVLSLQIEGLT